MKGYLFGNLVLLILLFPGFGIAAHLNVVDKPVTSDFLVKKWTTRDGLPQNTVTSIVQTSDGYLWLGTFGGLARFDGVKFDVFDAANTSGFRTNRVLSLLEDSHGTLWVGTDSGEVYLIRNDAILELDFGLRSDRREVWAIEQDGSGVMYLSSTGGLESIQLAADGTPLTDSGITLSELDSYGLFKDGNGRVWAKLWDGLVLLNREGFVQAKALGLDLPTSIFDVAFATNGKSVIGASGTVGIFDGRNFDEVESLSESKHRAGFAVGETRGTFWFQQVDELFRIGSGSVTRYDLDGYVSTGSRAILEDNEGNIWLATQTDGLVRLRPRMIASVAEMSGQESISAYAIIEGPDGTVWIAGEKLLAVKEGSVRRIRAAPGQPSPSVLQSLAVGADGRIWAGGQLGLWYVESGTLIPVPGFREKRVQALLLDRSGALWIGTDKGLLRQFNGEITSFESEQGVAGASIHLVTQLRDGSIWIGTRRGAGRYVNSRFEPVALFDPPDSPFVRDIVETKDGSIWVATYGGGLVRLRDGKTRSVTRSNGLINNFLSRVLVDGDERFWIHSNAGVAVVERAALDRVAGGEDAFLGGAHFSEDDGMTSSEARGGHQPAGLLASDGRVWFPTITDVIVINPALVPTTVPKIFIERAHSREQGEPADQAQLKFDPYQEIKIEDGLRNLEIEYSGLSLSKPEGIRYFYKLDGLDSEWIDAGTRKVAFYPFLPAGNYLFVVKAVNSNGIWTEVPATVRITVAQKFYETRWFLILIAGLVVLVGIAVFYLRSRQAELRQAEQVKFSRELIRANENVRSRIASELHDGISHNLLVMANWARTGRTASDAAHSHLEGYFDKIANLANDSLAETRAIVEGLGSQNISRFGLTEAILDMIDNVEEASGVVFETDIDNIDGLLYPEAEIGLFRALQECINNILKHTESPRATLSIRRRESSVRALLADHGSGFDVTAVLQENSRSDGTGLGVRNLVRRIQLLGGSVTIDSRASVGTTVQIELPANES